MKKNLVTIKPNPGPQTRNSKVMEISFFDEQGNYYGMLLGLTMWHNGSPIVNLYRIDEGIEIHVDEKREE